MSKPDSDGRPAFPMPLPLAFSGLSKRDLFAAAALTGRGSEIRGAEPSETARISYEYADAMLEERAKAQIITEPCSPRSDLPVWQQLQLHKKDWESLRREKHGPCVGITYDGERILWWDSDVEFIACMNAHFAEPDLCAIRKQRQDQFWADKLGDKNTPEHIQKVYHNIVHGILDPFSV